MVSFEWDTGKARQNRRKHRVYFQETATVFGDPLAATYPDPDHSTSDSVLSRLEMSNAGQIFFQEI